MEFGKRARPLYREKKGPFSMKTPFFSLEPRSRTETLAKENLVGPKNCAHCNFQALHSVSNNEGSLLPRRVGVTSGSS